LGRVFPRPARHIGDPFSFAQGYDAAHELTATENISSVLDWRQLKRDGALAAGRQDAFDAKPRSSVGERAKQRLVQQLVSQTAVEALDRGVLRRFARRDPVPVDPAQPNALLHVELANLFGYYWRTVSKPLVSVLSPGE
jgi:hypothetical protein